MDDAVHSRTLATQNCELLTVHLKIGIFDSTLEDWNF